MGIQGPFACLDARRPKRFPLPGLVLPSMTINSVLSVRSRSSAAGAVAARLSRVGASRSAGRGLVAAVDPDDEEEGDEEDLAVSQPLSDEESSFDDFDDEFDDDFEEDENDPDWDHPDDAEAEEPPPGKGGGRK